MSRIIHCVSIYIPFSLPAVISPLVSPNLTRLQANAFVQCDPKLETIGVQTIKAWPPVEIHKLEEKLAATTAAHKKEIENMCKQMEKVRGLKILLPKFVTRRNEPHPAKNYKLLFELLFRMNVTIGLIQGKAQAESWLAEKRELESRIRTHSLCLKDANRKESGLRSKIAALEQQVSGSQDEIAKFEGGAQGRKL